MLRRSGVGGVEVNRVGVHRHEREPGVVEVGDSAAGPMLESLAGGEILEVAVHANAMRGRVIGNYTTGAPVAIDCASFDQSMARRLKKLLVANRGEIALRIIRSARVFGLKTVAVYSAADAKSAHVGAADEAILDRAGRGCEELSQYRGDYREPQNNPAPTRFILATDFCRSVPSSRRLPPTRRSFLSDRGRMLWLRWATRSRHGESQSRLEFRWCRESKPPKFPQRASFAAQVSYPILIKAAAGGGGRGMRVVAEAAQLESALEAAAREAAAAFGDGRIFIEKYLAHPRHIEIQILGDEHGNVVALGERDCSIQRRHQKIVEESPAPGLSNEMRAKMIDAALKLARASHYTNAGTVEFLVEGDNFYFLEVNARLQVEHPVTEMRFGCDLVCEQLRIASGDKVLEPAAPRGAAIECRINAEDPEHDFRPATGTVLHLSVPGGPGVRFDSHLTRGAEVTPWYDGLLGKLICYGANREEARVRLVNALGEFALLGVTNNAAYLRDIIASDQFRDAKFSTHFID